jgi:hypothetical protein
MPIPLTPKYDAARLRAAARASKDAGQTRRLLALAAIYEGATRTEAATIGGVMLQIVRDWVLALNAHGPVGLINLKSRGPTAILLKGLAPSGLPFRSSLPPYSLRGRGHSTPSSAASLPAGGSPENSPSRTPQGRRMRSLW